MEKNFEIKNLDEVKVVNRNYCLYTDRAGYLLESGKLVYVKVTNIIIDLKAQSAITTIQDKEGNEYQLPEGFLLYYTPADFEANNPIKAYDYATRSLIGSTSRLYDYTNVIPKKEGDTNEFCFAGGYIFINNDAIFVPFEVNKVEWEICKGWSMIDGSIPNVFYKSREAAFSFNEYKVVDEDGEEFLERGHGLRLQLTDEQKSIVEEMREAFRKAKEAGVRFIWDRENCGDIQAYNGNEVAEFGYDDGYLTKDGDKVEIGENIKLHSTGIDFYDYNTCDDYVFVLKKTPLQEKKWKKNHPVD